MKNFKNEFTKVVGKEGFTLAETLITVAILGVVAAITIPAIINHQTESANRTKLKKAMTTYEKALNQMIIENDIKSDAGIQALNTAGCTITTEYFKKVEGSGCRFKTADRIWWDISDIENPVISLKDEITEANAATMKTNAKSLDSDRTSFAMIGRLDDTTGVLRINDKGAETTTPNKEYMAKLYNFSNNQKGETSCGAYCQASKMSACTGELKNCYEISEFNVDYYDENGDFLMRKSSCMGGTGKNCKALVFPINITLKNGYSLDSGPVSDDMFYMDGCSEGINGSIDNCTSFLGTIIDDKGVKTMYYTGEGGGCFDPDNNYNEKSCPLTSSEIAALF